MNKDDNKQPQGEIANEAFREKEPFFINTEQTKKEQNKQVNPNQNNANDKPTTNQPTTNLSKK